MIIYQVIVRYVYSGLHIFLAASGEEGNGMQLFQIAKEHRGTVLKFQVNQFALALFSLMVFVFTMQNKFTMFFCGLFTMAFYWYLIYHLMWNIGGKDRIRVDGGRAKKIRWKGFYIGLLANLFNLLLVVMNLIFTPLFMNQPLDTVLAMIVPIIIPFNLLKAGVNCLVTLLLFRSIGKAVRA